MTNLKAFQSTRLSRASTVQKTSAFLCIGISIHKALASLDLRKKSVLSSWKYFNPQGSREPRPHRNIRTVKPWWFQSTRLSRASTTQYYRSKDGICISIHKALASLDATLVQLGCNLTISIHKALASLDVYSNVGDLYPSIFQSTRLSRASTAKLSKTAPHPP